MSYYDINLHIPGKSAKETLKTVQNGWLFPEQISKARELASGKAGENECERYLCKLEESASSNYAFWLQSQ